MKRICLLLTLLSGFVFSTSKAQDAAKSDVTLVKLYDGLKNPWGMAFLPDGRMLVTDRSGEIFVFKNDKYTGAKLVGVPPVVARGQGGLMDIQVHPDYKKNGWIYISFSKPVGDLSTTAVVRFKLKGIQVVEKQDVFEAKPALKADFHFGSRLAFDKDKFLFVSVGERGTQPKVLLLDNDHGKVHRMFDDGKVPTDNPFAGTEGAHASIWSYGHRNPQGLVYDAATNRLWSVEHGPKGGDELNLIEKGKNYGWPKASYGINYDGTVLTPDKELEGVENPKHYWVPSIGPCGMTIVTSNKYPEWKGNLLVGALAFTHLNRITLDGATYKSEDRMFQGKGRFRHVAESPDGFIYAVAEGVGANGVLYKVLPAK